MKQLEQSNGSVFFLGSSNHVLDKIEERLSVQFPNVRVNLLSPAYKQEFSKSDLEYFANKINQANPDVVFVGLTAPKQEKLIHNIRLNINPNLISGIGAVFDFYAGTVKRPSKLWIKLHLEWLGRLSIEPKRLWRRNFISTPIFLKDMLMYKVFGKK
jgi:N-acetylglucosaminyldiphosphoundecaprenol N-acetyl-beta-D-mannosaminyltransferase